MAAGEYVSVSSQRDTERADLEVERRELIATPEAEREELARIYRDRGLSAGLAEQVADELSQLDQLTVHARDELGIDVHALANPIQAAVVSALSFVIGAVIPILVVVIASPSLRVPLTVAVTLVGLILLGVRPQIPHDLLQADDIRVPNRVGDPNQVVHTVLPTGVLDVVRDDPDDTHGRTL